MTSGKDATDIGSDSPCESAAAGGRTAPRRAKRPPVYSRMASHRTIAAGRTRFWLSARPCSRDRARRGVEGVEESIHGVIAQGVEVWPWARTHGARADDGSD